MQMTFTFNFTGCLWGRN